MYDQIREDHLFIICYSIVTAMAMMASCYLLLRRANAIAPDVTPPVRLRRWAAAFLASIATNHLWYMPIFFLDSGNDIKVADLIGGLLDSMTFFPLAIVVLLTMLQDRRRPLWPVAVMMAPIVAAGVWSVVAHSYALQPAVYVYFLLMCTGLIIYIVRALRRYGRWLRDNFADLEHKEVWQSFVVLAVMLTAFFIYASTSEGPVYQYAMQVSCSLLICYLLWRVETLSDLGDTVSRNEEMFSRNNPSSDLQQKLQRHCIGTQLYLQHDLTITQLAKAVGTNRLYLSQYFSSQGITYNAYINDLRIQHFMSLYREAVATKRPFTARQLASESGYRSYSTFGIAFKQRMGQTVTAWMRNT